MKNVAYRYRLMLDLTNNALAIVAMCARFVNSQSFSYFDLWSGDNTGVSNLVERSFPVPCNFRCSFQFPHISYFQSLISLLHTSYYLYGSHSYFLLMSSNFLSDSAKTYRASFRWFSNSSEEISKSLIASKTHRCPLRWWRCRAQACSSGWSARQPWGKHGASCSPEEIFLSCFSKTNTKRIYDFISDLSCKPVLSHISLVL